MRPFVLADIVPKEEAASYIYARGSSCSVGMYLDLEHLQMLGRVVNEELERLGGT